MSGDSDPLHSNNEESEVLSAEEIIRLWEAKSNFLPLASRKEGALKTAAKYRELKEAVSKFYETMENQKQEIPVSAVASLGNSQSLSRAQQIVKLLELGKGRRAINQFIHQWGQLHSQYSILEKAKMAFTALETNSRGPKLIPKILKQYEKRLNFSENKSDLFKSAAESISRSLAVSKMLETIPRGAELAPAPEAHQAENQVSSELVSLSTVSPVSQHSSVGSQLPGLIRGFGHDSSSDSSSDSSRRSSVAEEPEATDHPVENTGSETRNMRQPEAVIRSVRHDSSSDSSSDSSRRSSVAEASDAIENLVESANLEMIKNSLKQAQDIAQFCFIFQTNEVLFEKPNKATKTELLNKAKSLISAATIPQQVAQIYQTLEPTLSYQRKSRHIGKTDSTIELLKAAKAKLIALAQQQGSNKNEFTDNLVRKVMGEKQHCYSFACFKTKTEKEINKHFEKVSNQNRGHEAHNEREERLSFSRRGGRFGSDLSDDFSLSDG